MRTLLERSREVRNMAQSILKESQLPAMLSEYGEVKVGGSYALDVMLRPDIDLFIVTKKHDWEWVRNFYVRMMDTRYFREFDFVNWVDFERDEGKMRGYYFQAWVPKGDDLWKLDIWLITPEYDRSQELTERFKRLLEKEDAEQKRMAVLKIKEAMRFGKKYKPGVDGKLIYEAVLERGIRTPEEFIGFLSDRS